MTPDASSASPELTVLLHCLAPALTTVKRNDRINAMYEHGDIVRASKISKLEVPPIYETKVHSKTMVLHRLRNFLNSISLDTKNMSILVPRGISSVESGMDMSEIFKPLKLAIEGGYQPKYMSQDQWGRMCQLLDNHHLGDRIFGSDNMTEGFAQEVDHILKIWNQLHQANQVIEYRTGEQPIAFLDSPDGVLSELPVVQEHKQQIEDSARWVPSHVLRKKPENSVAYDDFPEALQARKIKVEGEGKKFVIQPWELNHFLDGGKDIDTGMVNPMGGQLTNSVLLQEAFSYMSPNGETPKQALQTISDFGRELAMGKISYPAGRILGGAHSAVGV